MPIEPTPAGTALPGRVPANNGPRYRWYHKFTALLFIIFCLEMGLFLVLFPWTEQWDSNFFADLVPQWRQLWSNAYFRGAVSGLGVLNLYIGFVEIFRLRRFAAPRGPNGS